jgi:hypothetical protein
MSLRRNAHRGDVDPRGIIYSNNSNIKLGPEMAFDLLAFEAWDSQ